jgi:uncharacterized protein YkwD
MALALASALPGCAPSGAAARPPVAAVATSSLEHTVVDLVNRHRRERGLPALVPDDRIGDRARLHSVAMAAGKTPFGHAGFDDRVRALRALLKFQASAENVAMNQGHRDPAAEAVRGWIASRGHRKNIEGPYQRTGVGVASNPKGEVYFTQLFVGR